MPAYLTAVSIAAESGLATVQGSNISLLHTQNLCLLMLEAVCSGSSLLAHELATTKIRDDHKETTSA